MEGIRKVEKPDDLSFLPLKLPLVTKAPIMAMVPYIERVIYPARHIEVQILVVMSLDMCHLGERDCSLQRNKTKRFWKKVPRLQSEKRCVMIGAAALFERESVVAMRIVEPLFLLLMKQVAISFSWR